MKNLSFKQRIVNLWDYYRYHALIVIFCIVFFVIFFPPYLQRRNMTYFQLLSSTAPRLQKKTVRLCPTILPPYLAVTQSMMLFI